MSSDGVSIQDLSVIGIDTMLINTSNQAVHKALKGLFEQAVKDDIRVQDPAEVGSLTHFEDGRLIVGSPLKGRFAAIGRMLYFGPTIDVTDTINIGMANQYRITNDDKKRFQELLKHPVYVGVYEVQGNTTLLSNQEKHTVLEDRDAKDSQGRPIRTVITKKDANIEDILNTDMLQAIAKVAKNSHSSFIDYHRMTIGG